MLSEGASIDAEFLRTIPGKSSCPVAFDASMDRRRAVMSSVKTGANSVNAGASRSAGALAHSASGHVQLRQKFGRGFQQVLVVGLNFSLVQSPRLSYSRASVHPFRPTVGELENTDPLASDLACTRLRGECGVALAGGHRLESVKEVGGPCFVDAQQIQVQDTPWARSAARLTRRL